MRGKPERCVARSSSVISAPVGLATSFRLAIPRTGHRGISPSPVRPSAPARDRKTVMEPISAIESGFGCSVRKDAPYAVLPDPDGDTRSPSQAHMPPRLRAAARSRFITDCRLALQPEPSLDRGESWKPSAPRPVCKRAASTRLRGMCRVATVRSSAVATAATLARNMVRARTGKGASTRTSRRSGNMESQLRTANRPTTSIVVADQKMFRLPQEAIKSAWGAYGCPRS